MDPRERADAALARARARGTFVVTPDDAISPMDATSTVQIPRAMVVAAEYDHPDSTIVIAAGTASGQVPHSHQYPPQHYPEPVYPQHHQPHHAQHQSHYQHYPPAPVQHWSEQQPQPLPEEQPRQLDGLVPTVQQPGAGRSMLSRRLDGN